MLVLLRKVFFFKIVFFLLFIISYNLFYVKQKSNKYKQEFHGTNIEDSYRNLENLEDTIVLDWIKENNKLTQQYYKEIIQSENIFNEVTKLYQTKSSLKSNYVITSNDVYFFLERSSSGGSYSKLYYKKGIDGAVELILDTEKIKTGHTINYFEPCWDGSKVALGITQKDEEFSDILIVDTHSKKVVFESTKKMWPSALGGIKWNSSCNGFYYTYVPVTDKKQKDYLFNTQGAFYDLTKDNKELKVLFSKSANDSIPFKEEDFPLLYFDATINEHIIGTIAGVNAYRDGYYTTVKSIYDTKTKWEPLFKKSDKVKSFFLNKEDFIYLTSKNASNFKLCKTSILTPNFENPDILIEEDKSEIISSFAVTKDGVYFVRVKNGVEANLKFLSFKGIEKSIPLPKKAGSISLETKGVTSSDLWITIQGWSTKSQRFFYDSLQDQLLTDDKKPLTHDSDTSNEIIVEELLVNSYDGNEIPLSLIYKKGLSKNKNNRLFITAYGAYGRNIRPRSTALLSTWINQRGIYAVAHVRGGGEKGNEWYIDGFKTKKRNSWKDLISCIEFLHKNDYSSPSLTVGWGASAGAISVGIAALEKPNLFSAVVITSGLLNPLRLEHAPNGKNNAKEFGSTRNSEEFKSLLEMDAYHQIKKDQPYPAFLITTGFNDSRVAAWQSIKFTAKLKECSNSNKPILLSTDFDSGHGRENSRKKLLQKISKRIVFALSQTGHPAYQPE